MIQVWNYSKIAQHYLNPKENNLYLKEEEEIRFNNSQYKYYNLILKGKKRRQSCQNDCGQKDKKIIEEEEISLS